MCVCVCVCVCVCDVRAGCYRWKSLGEGWEEGREAGKERSRGGDGREGDERRGEEKELGDCRWFRFGWRVEL